MVHLYRKGMVMMLTLSALLLGACTMMVQPESALPDSGMVETDTVAEFVLPDGTSCLFSGTGATVAFDGKRANYTCTPVEASESATQTLAILNDPVIAGQTEYAVDFATIAQTDGGFELHASEVITFTAWEVVLDDGRVCLHAGFGATMGFEDRRLNYTCDKGDSTADEVGLMGELTKQGEGVWLAQIDEIGRDANGFVQLSSTQVPVAKISGAEVTPGASEAAPETTEASSEIIGTTWQWVQTEYGDDSIVAPSDPTLYTLLFNADGSVFVQLDCNSGSGSYTLDEASLIFGPIASTLMACPEGSQATEFANDLANVYSFVMQDGHLFLSLKLDTGIMEFAPVSTAEEATPAATEEVTEEASEEAATNEVVGTTWQWVQTEYGDGSIVAPGDSAIFTLLLNEDGTVFAQLDCNTGRGSYTLDSPSITFGPMASTMMACAENSTAFEFGRDLEGVVSYVMQDGNLFLAIKFDTGIMEFAPVAAEGEATPEATEEATPEATEEASEEAASPEVVGTTWQWVQTQYSDDTLLVPSDPTQYTLLLNEDGTVFAQLDCNTGSGSYTLDAPSLTFGPMASTMRGCPEGSQAFEFGRDLSNVNSFVMQDGHLFLAIKLDTGIMEFAPVE